MKTIFEHIERVKGQPHHIRKQVAFAAAASLTAFIAIVWFIGSLSMGVFSIKGGSFAAGAEQGSAAASDTSGSQNLAGVGAAAALPQSANTPASIEIIDAATAPAVQKQAEQTTIPF